REISFPGGKLICENITKTNCFAENKAYLSADKLKYPLKLRLWRPGDAFKPLGMKGHRKISDFLKDKKTTLFDKENTWVLLSEGTIVWLVGHRIHDTYRVR